MDQLLAEIAETFPAFQRVMSSPDVQSPYSRMEQFARIVIDAYDSGARDRLPAAFEIVERHLASDRPDVRDALVLGFLESVQNIASHRPFGSAVFVPYLGVHSRTAWDELNVSWEGKNGLAEVIASERGSLQKAPWWQFWRRRRSAVDSLKDVQDPELRAIIEGMTRDHSKSKE